MNAYSKVLRMRLGGPNRPDCEIGGVHVYLVKVTGAMGGKHRYKIIESLVVQNL